MSGSEGTTGGDDLEARRLASLRHLIRGSHLSRPDGLPDLCTEAARAIGAVAADVYVVDYDQVVLTRLGTHQDRGGGAPVLDVDGTLAGRSFRDASTQFASSPSGTVLWVPLIDGAARLGVVEFVFPADLDGDAELLQSCEDIAGLVAGLVVTHSLYGDAIERARRRAPLSVSAELQWKLLPPLAFMSPRLSIAGVLVPSTQIAGDSFDYAIDGDTAHIAIVDAMGHGMEAALLAAVAIGAMRNARRRGSDLRATADSVDSEVAGAFGPDKFVTAVLGQLDLGAGVWTWTTCGHPPALLVRQGRVVKTLDAAVGPPLGLGLVGKEPELASERLEPGDRLVLYTDGLTEARDASGDFFGIERLAEYVAKHDASGAPAAEVLRRLSHESLGYSGTTPHDDATMLMVEWLGDDARRTFSG